MDKHRLNLCLVAPAQPKAQTVYRRVLRLFDRQRESLGSIVVGRGLDSMMGETGWTSFESLGKYDSEVGRGLDSIPEETGWLILDSLKECDFGAVCPDLFLCWDMPAVCEVLSLTQTAPIIYGVTLDTIFHGFLPAHQRIVGYFHDAPFLRELVASCGIPLGRQFSLTAGVEPDACVSPKRSGLEPRKGVLLIADDFAFISSVKSVCGLLGERLERLSCGTAAQGLPPDFFTLYDCIIASEAVALCAAAAGRPVIVADERGSAGLLTRENLQRVLEAHAGPACFESSSGFEELLAALSKSRGLDSVELARELCDTHNEVVRARQWVDWLRKVGESSRIAVTERERSRERLHWLPFDVRGGVLVHSDRVNPAARTASDKLMLPPASEVLLDFGEPLIPALIFDAGRPLVRLPLDQHIAVNDEEPLVGVFGEGWSSGESWGRWTDGYEAVLEFELEPDNGDLELLLDVHAFLPPGRLFQRVTVRVNGSLVMCWKLDRDARRAPFGVPLRRAELGDGGVCRLTFYLPDADSPFAWGRPDSRKLGLALTGLRLRLTRPFS